MAVDISAEVTRTWPTTEAKLEADDTVNYTTQKSKAIARAKRTLYGTNTIPSESDIPEPAAYWIADQAVVYLIPAARSWYAHHTRRSDNKENATITYHDTLAMLDRLETELKAGLASTKDDALESLSVGDAYEDVPQVSSQGMLVDPVSQVFKRGPWPS